MTTAYSNGERCECGGTLESCNFFPVDRLAWAAEEGRRQGYEVVAFFGCRTCGDWTVLPAARIPGHGTQGAGHA